MSGRHFKMKNFIVFLSLFATSSTIRVPIWNNGNEHVVNRDTRPRISDGPRQQSNSFRELDVLLTPENQGWSPLVPKITVIPSASKHKYYKKPLDKQSYYKKNFFSNPYKQSSTKNVINSVNVVPFDTYKKTNDANNFAYADPSYINNFFNQLSQISNKQKPQSTVKFEDNFQTQISTNTYPFDQNQFFKVPIIPKPETKSLPNHPQFIQKAESSLIPQKKSHLDNFYNFKPLQDLEQVEDAFINHKNQPLINKPEYVSHLTKNYRDHKTHEPNQYDPHYITGQELKVEREKHEKAPVSSHEIPVEIPTNPIYPGPGLWAKPGLKHKPFITKQKYDKLEEDKVKPDGYDTFEAGQKLFQNHNNAFVQNLQNFPKQHQFSTIEQNQPSENIQEKTDTNEEVNEDSEEDNEFVPMKLYAQVRASENTEHLPENEDDGRLRESIKEAKVHTVYTEEGYEDSAYDHAGHEKEAANNEGFEDLQRAKIEKKEKRPAHTKYNLHIPKVSTTKYSVGNGVLSDEEIERLQEEELSIADADAAGTQYEEIKSAETDNNSGEATVVNNEKKFATSKPIKENKNFITTKETKTMMTKEKDNGNTETEFSSKINIVLQPNNSTKTQKYEKIYPKVYKTIQRIKTIPVVKEPLNHAEINPVNFSGIFIEEIISSTPTPPTEELSEEIPITTLPTTAIPKPNKNDKFEALESINRGFLNTKRRLKRYTNDFSDIRLNAQFLPLINHGVGKVKVDNTHSKYPYYDKYKDKGIHENSPLRYSENLKNIPIKTGKNMVVYEEADRKVTCPEIRQTVNAIPERVLKAEQNNEEENESEEDTDDEIITEPKKLAEQPKTPRLSGLGDQIDCLKLKYFGENPLDSPIFKEDTIAPPVPIFNILLEKHVSKYPEQQSHQFGNKPAPTQNTANILTNNDINNNNSKTNKLENQKIKATTPNSIQIVNLLTTPKYTVSLKPKHIYHQIKLLDHLPEETNIEKELNIEKEIQKPQPEALDEENLTVESSYHHLVPDTAIRTVNNGNGAPFLIFDVNKFIPDRLNKPNEETEVKSVNATSRQSKAIHDETEKEAEMLPEAEEWRRRKIKKKRPPFQIFDINKYLPTTPFSIFNENIQTSTVLPKYIVKSEVFYKDQIQPNEQLHVLTDILNNIKNSSQEQPSDAAIQSSEPVSVSLSANKNHINPKLTKTRPYFQDSYLQAYGDQEVDPNYYSSQTTTSTTAPTSATTIKPVTLRRNINFRKRSKPSTHLSTRPTVNPAIIRDREETFKLYLSLLEANKQPQYSTSTRNNDFDYGVTIPVTEKINEYVEKTTKVMGLMPPSTQRYKTISHPKRDNTLHVSNPGSNKVLKVNKFYVVGMRPPPKQKLILYPEFIINKNNHMLTRGKRSTSKSSSYASLTRNTDQTEKKLEKPIVVDSEEDEAPHRPKNYYYNEKTGKIVYLTTEKPESQEEEEEMEYEEIIEQPSSTSKPLQDPIFATATPPPKGKSYVDFVNKLHDISGYKNIPDPTTTEKGQEVSTTTLKPESTTPPPFLDILNKLRQNSQYKVIEDKKEQKVKTTTTEVPEKIVDNDEDEEDEEEERGFKNLQNSPGHLLNEHYKQFGIFDVTDYIPKIKNYLPKTSYDISKYKTIARSTPRPTTEDDSDAEEATTSITRTTQKPFVISTEEPGSIDSLNEATINKETEKAPIPLQRRRLKTTSGSTVATTTSTERPSTKWPLENRRRRPTTLRSIRTSTMATTIKTALPSSTEAAAEQVEKLRRNYRRRPTRIQTEHTSPVHLEEDEENTTKVVRRRSDSTGTNTPKIRSKNFVETFKTYHRNKKHGPNYRNVENADENSSVIKNVTQSLPQVTNNGTVEIVADYDKTKRHGGNYRSEEDVTNEDQGNDSEDIVDIGPKISDDKLVIDLLPKESNESTDDSEEHVETTTLKINSPKTFSINEKDVVSEGLPDILPTRKSLVRGRFSNSKQKNVDNNQKHQNIVTEPTLMRLTDIVPKPESFYKDPTLSTSVNMLESKSKPTNDEIISILSSTESDESTENSEKLYSYASSKKPNIIKDPSKRLYYYAPI